MNNCQEALDELKHCETYYGLGVKSKQHINNKYSNDLQKLLDKQEKYRWHDLRKDPNDLPAPLSTNIYVLANWNNHCLNKYGLVDFSKDSEWCIVDKVFEEIDVIAWKYIEEFEDE